jgi:hypothetical protein
LIPLAGKKQSNKKPPEFTVRSFCLYIAPTDKDYPCYMEQTSKNKQQTDPASTPENETKKNILAKLFSTNCKWKKP